MSTEARAEILSRIRSALHDVPEDEPIEGVVARDYRVAHVGQDPAALSELLAENLADYRARVHRCGEEQLPQRIAELLRERGSTSFIAPAGLPPGWLAQCTGFQDASQAERRAPLTARELDGVDSVVTGCAIAIAETGTIVLDAGAGQGRRALTLVPDHHVCVIRCPAQVVASLPLALPRLDPHRPLTWISGPSATSDIEFSRVEGVHGPRTLDVVLVAEVAAAEL
jgi:L-lactate dehydrogenase complex protein LldG